MVVGWTHDELVCESTLTIDDKSYRVAWDFPALYTYYRSTGENATLDGIGKDPFHLIALLWVGLLGAAPDIEIKEVKTWYTSRTAALLYEGTIKAFRMEMPEPDHRGEAQPDPPSA